MRLDALRIAVAKQKWARAMVNSGDASKRKAAPMAISVLSAILAHLADPGPTSRGLVSASESAGTPTVGSKP